MSAENTNAGGGEAVEREALLLTSAEEAARWFTRRLSDSDWRPNRGNIEAARNAILDAAAAGRRLAALSAHSTGSAGVAVEPMAWLWERCVREYPGEGIWETTATVVRPVANVCCRNIRPLYERPPVAAEPEAGWRLVPDECTPEMMRAFWLAGPYPEKPFRPGYHAMLAAAPTPPTGGGETEDGATADGRFFGNLEATYPAPTEADLADPQFGAIWQVIKSWDLNVHGAYGGYCGAMGNHVMAVLNAVRSVTPSPASPAGDLISLSAGAKERSRLEAEGWSQASVVSCYWIRSQPDHNLVQVVNRDLRLLYEATHELAPTAPRKGPSEEEIADLCDRLDRLNTISEPQTCSDVMDEARLMILALASFDQNRGEPDQGGANTEAGR